MAVEVIWSVRSAQVYLGGGKKGRRYQAVAYLRHFCREDSFPIWRRHHALGPGPLRKQKAEAEADARARGPVDMRVEHNWPAIWPHEILDTPELEAAWRLGAVTLCVMMGSPAKPPHAPPYGRSAPLKHYVGVAVQDLDPHAAQDSAPRFRFLKAVGAMTGPQVNNLASSLMAHTSRCYDPLPAPGTFCYPMIPVRAL